MRRIYLPIAIAICLLFMYLGHRLGSHVPYEKEVTIKTLFKRNAALEKEKEKSNERLQVLVEKNYQDSIRIAELEAKVRVNDHEVEAVTKRIKKKVEIVAKYTPVQRDSFFVARYPGQDTIVDVNSQKVVEELVRIEGLDSLSKVLVKQVKDLKAVSAAKDERIATQSDIIDELSFKTAVLEEQGQNKDDLIGHYKGEARKYKRQRNHVLAGVTAVVVTGVIAVFR